MRSKPFKAFHTPDSSKPQADYMGQAIKNPTARSIDVMGVKESKSNKFGKPPKKLA